ncbi:signal peptidase II [Mycoplasmatota bacterium WC44]
MIYGIILIVSLVILDQVTKLIVIDAIPLYTNIPIIDGFFSLSHHVNDGAAWSIFSGQMAFFYIITIAALIIFGYYFKDVDFKNNKLYSFGISIIIAGAIGNFIDRIRVQGVVDFLDFRIFGYDFPVFNVADICLTVGVTMFIIATIFYNEKTVG